MPIFVLLAAFIGGMSVAADVTAGERERGSLESLLLHPVSRLAIAGGKWLAVSAVAVATVDAGAGHVVRRAAAPAPAGPRPADRLGAADALWMLARAGAAGAGRRRPCSC